MSQIIRSSRRLRSINSKFLRSSASKPLCSAATSSPSTSTIPSIDATPPIEDGPRKPWSFLKIGAISAATATLGVTAYATYAYSLEEVGQKKSALHGMLKKYAVRDDASALEVRLI